jgi:hypothetical protein
MTLLDRILTGVITPCSGVEGHYRGANSHLYCYDADPLSLLCSAMWYESGV